MPLTQGQTILLCQIAECTGFDPRCLRALGSIPDFCGTGLDPRCRRVLGLIPHVCDTGCHGSPLSQGLLLDDHSGKTNDIKAMMQIGP